MVHIRIVQGPGAELVVDLPEWEGDIPQRGDYIFHPPQLGEPYDPGDLYQVAGCVSQRTWRTHDRVQTEEGVKFVMSAHPYVQLSLGY